MKRTAVTLRANAGGGSSTVIKKVKIHHAETSRRLVVRIEADSSHDVSYTFFVQ